MPRKKAQQIETAEQIEWTPKAEVKGHVADPRTLLDKIKTREGVIGYILRGSTSAAVDIKDPSKIIDYAVLSAETLESAESLSETFALGKINNIVAKGKDLKILLLSKGEHRISVFMEKNVDHNSIYKEMT